MWAIQFIAGSPVCGLDVLRAFLRRLDHRLLLLRVVFLMRNGLAYWTAHSDLQHHGGKVRDQTKQRGAMLEVDAPKRVALVMTMLVATSCAGAPSAPTVASSALLSASSDILLVGESLQLSARHNATEAMIAIDWVNLTPDVASINGNVLTGLRHGEAVIGARNSPSSLRIRVIENFSGLYPGGRNAIGDPLLGIAYAVECVEFVRSYCAFNVLEERLGKGPERFGMLLTQNRDVVTGVASINCGGGTVSGTVDAAGRLALKGSFGLKGPPTCHIEEWSTWLVDGRAMHGRFKYRSSGGLVTYEFRGISRTPQ